MIPSDETPSTKTAWIVDDDEEMLSAVKLMFRLLDYETRSFLNARDAAKILQYGNTPDLIILDINMPEISGLDFLEFIRRRREWDKIPIVMLSTESADVTVDRALAMGADHYIAKPVTMDELESAIDQAVQKRSG